MSKLCENTVGALKQGHVVLQARHCQSRIWVQLSKEPWVRHSGMVSAGMTFLLKMLFIYSTIITAYTFYNYSNILGNLGNSRVYKCFSCILSHNPQISMFVCLQHRRKLRLMKENEFNQNHRAAKSQSLQLNPGLPAWNLHLFTFYKSCLESSRPGT